MKIQSLSVTVPNAKCINDCAFCVSKMHCNRYRNRMDDALPDFDLSLRDYLKRLDFARDNGCNTMMITGSSEPQQNRKFLTYLGMMLQMMERPFRWIEMQTTGVLLDGNYLRFLRNHVGVSLISLSLSSLSDERNLDIIRCPGNARFELGPLYEGIKKHGFALRLSLNLTSEFDRFRSRPEDLIRICRNIGADQATLRVLYSSGKNTPQDRWIERNAARPDTVRILNDYVKQEGTVLGVLPHGAVKYSVGGLCVVVDDDCMDKAGKTDENYKYLILQPDCRLYSQWDDPASLIF